MDLAVPLRIGAVRRELRQDEEWVDLRRSSLGTLAWDMLAPEARRALHLALADAAEGSLADAAAGGSRSLLDAMRRLCRVQRAWVDPLGRIAEVVVEEAAATLAAGRPEEALRLLDGPGHGGAGAAGEGPQRPEEVVTVHVGARHAILRGRALTMLGQLPAARAALQAARTLVKAAPLSEEPPGDVGGGEARAGDEGRRDGEGETAADRVAGDPVLADDLAVAEAIWGLAIAQRVAATAWEVVCVRAHRVPTAAPLEEAAALLLVAERERRSGRLADASARAGQVQALVRGYLREEGRRSGEGAVASGPLFVVYEDSLLLGMELAILRGDIDRAGFLHGELGGPGRPEAHLAGPADAGPGGDPCRSVRARVHGSRLAVARGQLGLALDLLRVPGEGPWARAAVEVARLELDIELGIGVSTQALARGLSACSDAATPWEVRRAWLRALALTRLAAGDTPAALDALLAGADAADAAEDFPEHALHSGLVALLTGRSERLSDAVDRLADAGLPRYQATLLLHGARSIGDPEVLVAAEAAARASGDRLLLLPILLALRGSGAREEAAAICRSALETLHGPERLRFEERREVRWALFT